MEYRASVLTLSSSYYVVSFSDEEVEVGSDLYEIDTEAEATVDASSPAAPAAAATESAAAAPSTPPPPTKSTPPPPPAAAQPKGHRTPSIHFLGKEGWSRVLSGSTIPVLQALPPNYGRPKFSEAEIDALIMGGADLAPEVKQYSSGAQFGY